MGRVRGPRVELFDLGIEPVRRPGPGGHELSGDRIQLPDTRNGLPGGGVGPTRRHEFRGIRIHRPRFRQTSVRSGSDGPALFRGSVPRRRRRHRGRGRSDRGPRPIDRPGGRSGPKRFDGRPPRKVRRNGSDVVTTARRLRADRRRRLAIVGCGRRTAHFALERPVRPSSTTDVTFEITDYKLYIIVKIE